MKSFPYFNNLKFTITSTNTKEFTPKRYTNLQQLPNIYFFLIFDSKNDKKLNHYHYYYPLAFKYTFLESNSNKIFIQCLI